MGNLAQNLLDTAAKEGQHPALRMDEAHLTYDEFRDAALRDVLVLAHYLDDNWSAMESVGLGEEVAG